MRRHAVEVTVTARRLQIASLVLMLLGVLGILARDIARHDASATASARAIEAQGAAP